MRSIPTTASCLSKYETADALYPVSARSLWRCRTGRCRVGAKRTPIGRFFGGLSKVPSPQLGAYAIQAVLAESPKIKDAVDEEREIEGFFDLMTPPHQLSLR